MGGLKEIPLEANFYLVVMGGGLFSVCFFQCFSVFFLFFFFFLGGGGVGVQEIQSRNGTCWGLLGKS